MRYKESETTEFKKSTSSLKSAIISIAAILNKHQHGDIYFGIKDDGTVVGQSVGEKTVRDISRTIADNIEPKIYPSIKYIKLKKKSCIHVKFKGSDVPYFAYGRAYMRMGDEDRQLSIKELENIIVKKNKDKLRWDTEICQKAKLTDISSRKIQTFLKASGLEYDSVKESLKKLKLLSGTKLLNAAVILFGKKPQAFFPSAKLRCAVFGGKDTSFAVDMKDFEGDLFSLIKRAEEYVLEHIHIGMQVEGLRRIDVPEIDREAIREGILNAFCHRNYYEYDSVNVAIFKDRVEIRSPGLLFGGLTIERIRNEMVSERRNELIADLFHRVHFIEKWGRGIRLILSREPNANFKEVGTHFITTLRRKASKQKQEKLITKTTPKTTLKTTPKSSEKIIAIIKRNPSITKEELAKELKLTVDGVKYHIRKLNKKGVLVWEGSSKAGRWKIIKS